MEEKIIGFLLCLETFSNFFFSKTGSQVAQAGLELSIQTKMTLKSWSFCFYLPFPGITGMCHYSKLLNFNFSLIIKTNDYEENMSITGVVYMFLSLQETVPLTKGRWWTLS